MKIIFTLITSTFFTFLLSFTRPTGKTGKVVYAEIASTIEKQLEGNASLTSCGDKIDNVTILPNGEIQLHCTNNETITLNLYELYKTNKTIYGMEMVDDHIIRFDLAEMDAISIRFKDASLTSQVYRSLVALIIAGKDEYSPALPLDINETIDSINNILLQSEYRSIVRVNIAGTVIITNDNMQFFSFNIADLVSSETAKGGFEVNGIEMMPTGLNNIINFNTADKRVAYIKFRGINESELATLHQLFIHLRISMLEIMQG